MLGKDLRPWGLAPWLLPKLNAEPWSVIGTISTEERSNAIFEHLNYERQINHVEFLNISDLDSRYSKECEELRAERLREFNVFTAGAASVKEFGLMESSRLIGRFFEGFLSASGGNLIVDISAMPKRFFFPLVRLALRSTQVKNLVAAYTVPARYADGALAYEPQDWAHLPLFQSERAPPLPDCKRMIVGVGFLPFHLPELVSHDYEAAEVVLVFPFPPGSPQYQRNWQFVQDIVSIGGGIRNRDIKRVDATDVSGCFDHLESAAQGSPETTILAPFGPKPHSLAMCLYAAKYNCDVFYTQPRYYNPHYSTGIKRGKDGKPFTVCYAIRVQGNDLY